MLRYCVNCKKEFEFPPLAVSGKVKLICPECGGIIDKNSRRPADDESVRKTEEAMGRAVGGLFHLAYIFYLALGIVGVLSFVFGLSGLLYAVTVVVLAVYIIQFATGNLAFTSGVVFLPVGAIIGFLIFKSIGGACLGIHVVFIVRHLIRDVIYRLIFRLIRMGS